MHVVLSIARKIVSNFYLGTSTVFFIWITFFDGSDLIGLFSNRMKLADTQNEIELYKKRIDLVIAEQARLAGKSDALECFARERFLMKKDNEDVFVVQQEPNNSILDALTGF
jgi:hypothetical protein